MKKKALALLVSLVLIVGTALPGTLAVSHDSETTSETTYSQECGTCHGIGTHTPGCTYYVAPTTTQSSTSGTDMDSNGSGTEYSQKCPNPGCTVIGSHVCQYAPSGDGDDGQSNNLPDNTGTVNGGSVTSSSGTRTEGTAEGNSLYESLMALGSYEELLKAVDGLTQTQVGLLTGTQVKGLMDRLDELGTINEAGIPVPGDESYDGPSLVISTASNYTVAAGLRPPVKGTAPVRKAMRSPAGIALDPEDYQLAAADRSEDNGVTLEKSFEWTNEAQGKGTITLEAWATGESFTQTTTTQTPTDIILVLDQSGSMTEKFSSLVDTFTQVSRTNAQHYTYRHNGGEKNLWYQLSDGSYVQVNMRMEEVDHTFQEIEKNWGFTNLACRDYFQNGELYYADGNEKKPVKNLERRWLGGLSVRYDYTWQDNTTETVRALQAPSKTLYRKVVSDYKYTYFYVDDQNVEHVIETKDGYNATPGQTYYRKERENVTTTRLAALQSAVGTFAGKVAELANDYNVEHRIAVVGFACGQRYGNTNYHYKNSEVFIGAQQYTYSEDMSSVYARAFQNMKTQEGKDNINASVAALAADGGTLTNLGLEMANGIFYSNPIPAGTERNRVVIVFTDGQPGWSGYDQTVANAALVEAGYSKNNFGATVYTVGIFDGANINGEDQVNNFMREMSSGAGTANGNGYYLTAGNADALGEIFKSISASINSGGANTTLTEAAVVRDILSQSFQLPAGTKKEDIKVYTQGVDPSTGVFSGELESLSDPGIKISGPIGEEQVSVSGFDFSANWVGPRKVNNSTSYDGRKLIIQVPVQVRDGFLGGNGVPTNKDTAGLYENAEATTAVENFVSPVTDVKIPDVTVTAPDKNVYLLASLTDAELKEGVTVKANENIVIDLDPNASNYGLEKWQYEYVKIIISGTGTSLTELVDDATYTLTCTIEPEKEGSATKKTGTGHGNIKVFKPEITFKDKNVLKGEVVTQDTLRGQQVGSTQWKHPDVTGENTTILGEVPEILLSGELPVGSLDNGKVQVTTDIDVDMSANIGDTVIDAYITYTWNRGGCPAEEDAIDTHEGNDPADTPEFRLHVKTGTLVITKSDGRPGEGFVFNVTNNDDVSMRVSCAGTDGSVTITDLPAGNYVVTEETGPAGAWRYNYTVSWTDENNEINDINTINADHPTIRVTVTNKQSNPYLLDGFAFRPNYQNAPQGGN